MGCRKSKCCYTPVAAVPAPQPALPSIAPIDPTFGGMPGMSPYPIPPPFPQMAPQLGPIGGFSPYPGIGGYPGY